MVASSRIVTTLSFAIALVGGMPLWNWLETAPRLMFVAGLLTGTVQELRGWWHLKNWHLNLSLVPVFIWYLFQYGRSNPVQPVVSVLVIMLAARLCGEKNIRNLMQINLLALFCLASRSLFDLNPAFLAWLALMLLLVPVSLVLLTFHATDNRLVFRRKELVTVLLAALAMTALTLPAMALLFPVLPRTAFPLWTFLAPPVAATVGMSDKVEPGAVPALAETGALAFRAEMPQQPQPPYWRGTVFNQINGTSWSRNPAVPHETSVPVGEPVTQTIYPEPSSSRILVSLDAASQLSRAWVRMSPDGVYESSRGLGRRVSYQARSATEGLLRTVTISNPDFYLKVPADISPQTRQLAERIGRQGRTDQERIKLAEQHFIKGGYRYSSKELPTGKDAMHQFLFVSKQGHCEFFASSLAILLRTAGVPARLVGGYLGGTYNEVGGYYLVRQDMAHVWVEAYVAGKGWQRIDPSRFATNAGAVWDQNKQLSLAIRLQLLADALDYRWNRAVVTYDFERQAGQLRMAGQKLQSLEQTIKTHWRLVLTSLCFAVIAAAVLKVRLGWLLSSKETRLLQRFRQVVKKRFGQGFETDNKGLFEIAAASNDARVQQFVTVYAAAVYQDKRLRSDEVRRLHQLLDELQRSKD